jgi:membrane fusion protein, multidrug efflux system
MPIALPLGSASSASFASSPRVAASCLVAVLLLLAACSKPEPTPEPIRAVRTLTVSAATTAPTQEFAADVRARVETRLGFRVGGKLVNRPAGLGDTVRAGQVLAQLDPQDLRLAQDAARAGMSAAQVNLDQATADLKRFRELRDQGFISGAELERRETAAKAAQAQLDQARSQLAVQGNQAQYTTLTATASGVITAVEAEPGAVVSSGAPIVRLAHDGPRDVVFAVPEDRVAQVHALAKVPGAFSVRTWGSDQPLPATIHEIAAAADPATRTFLVKVDVGAKASAGLKLGQTATVTLRAPAVGGVTKLPLAAVREEQGASSVWLVDPASMTVRSQPVQVAGADGNDVVIAGGLAPGQVVVTAGVHVLTAGQKVRFYANGGVATAATRTSATVPAGAAATASAPR